MFKKLKHMQRNIQVPDRRKIKSIFKRRLRSQHEVMDIRSYTIDIGIVKEKNKTYIEVFVYYHIKNNPNCRLQYVTAYRLN